MPDTSAVFTWRVGVRGYQFGRQLVDLGPASLDVSLIEVPGGVRSYRPDDHPTMFREFIGLAAGGPDALLTFADRYGILGQGYDPEGFPPDWHGSKTTESVRFWVHQNANLQQADQVLDMLRRGDRTALGARVRWFTTARRGEGGRWYFRHWRRVDTEQDYSPVEGTEEMVEAAHWAPVRADGLGPGEDPLVVARAWLNQEIGVRVRSHARVVFADDPQTGRPGFQVVPTTLLSFIWWQFGRSLASGQEYGECKECGKPFEIVPKDKGRRMFCGTSCKLKNFRKRQRQAEKLASEGKTPEQIAAATDTKLETVRDWLAKPKGGA